VVNRTHIVATLILLAFVVFAPASHALAQEHAAQPAAAAKAEGAKPAESGKPAEPGKPAEHGKAAEGGHGEEGGLSVTGMIAKLFNFAIMAGTLVYFLRSPIATYLKDRGVSIRGDLVKAADTKKAAAAQLAEVEKKLAALPGELEALRKSGADEVAAEEARMRQAAEAERTRLLEQATREIDWQLKIAQRDLAKHAGNLAVDIASARVKQTITDADQLRLVDRYVAQVGTK
jgi:F-type H+-transporting ATPase subunit b